MRTSLSRTARRIAAARADRHVVDERVRRVNDDRIRWLQTRNDFYSIAVVATYLDGNQFGFAVANESDLQAFLTEDEGIRRNGYRMGLVKQLPRFEI